MGLIRFVFRSTARSQSFGDMQAFGDLSFREVIEQSAIRRRRREAFRSSRPTAAIHASYGVAIQLKDSINRDSSAFHLDRSGNSSTGCVTSSMQLDGWVEDAVFEVCNSSSFILNILKE